MPSAGEWWVIQNIKEVATLNKQDIDALRELAAQIRRGCQQLINRASYDRTSIGQVTAVNGGGLYTVAAFGGKVYFAIQDIHSGGNGCPCEGAAEQLEGHLHRIYGVKNAQL